MGITDQSQYVAPLNNDLAKKDTIVKNNEQPYKNQGRVLR